MKIIQFMASSGGVGGLEQHTFNLVNELAEKHEMYLCIDKKYQEYQLIYPKIKFYFLDFSKSRWNLFLLWSLRNIINDVQPDIIHAQGGKAVKIISFMQIFFSIPTVATIHGVKNNIKDYLNYTRVIAVSNKAGEKVANYRQVDIIYNGIIMPEQPKNQKMAYRRALAIGRLDKVKQFDMLIQAWKDIDFKLDIIGDGEEYSYLQSLIKEYNLQDKVRLLGYSNQISVELALSDFLIISSAREGGPIVLAEALLLKKPVIATNVGMVSEFIPTEYIAENSSIEALQATIHYALTHQVNMEIDFEPAYQKAEQYLQLSAMVKQTEQLYQQILNQ